MGTCDRVPDVLRGFAYERLKQCVEEPCLEALGQNPEMLGPTIYSLDHSEHICDFVSYMQRRFSVDVVCACAIRSQIKANVVYEEVIDACKARHMQRLYSSSTSNVNRVVEHTYHLNRTFMLGSLCECRVSWKLSLSTISPVTATDPDDVRVCNSSLLSCNMFFKNAVTGETVSTGTDRVPMWVCVVCHGLEMTLNELKDVISSALLWPRPLSKKRCHVEAVEDASSSDSSRDDLICGTLASTRSPKRRATDSTRRL